MANDIQIIYTATRALIANSRANTEQSITFKASQSEPPLPNIDGRTQFSRRGRRKATTIYGEWRTGTIVVPYIEGIERLQWQEYLRSTEYEEPHRLIHNDFIGWNSEDSDLTVFRPLNSGRLTRIEQNDEYRLTIRWREIEA